MITYFNFDTKHRDFLLNSILTLDMSWRPQTYSLEENLRTAKKVSDEVEFRSFVYSNSSGFFLNSNSLRYDLSSSVGKISSIIINYYDRDLFFESLSLMRTLCSRRVNFAFSCEYDEYLHRNHVFQKFEGSSAESRIGMDVLRYVPGLYWMTYISDSILSLHGISMDELLAYSLFNEEIDGGTMLQLYSKPNSWVGCAQEIDHACYVTNGIFSKKEMLESVEGRLENLNPLSYLDLLDDWK